jgi:hypothetical protein
VDQYNTSRDLVTLLRASIIYDVTTSKANGTDEIIFSAQPDSVAIENFIEHSDTVDRSQILRTKIVMHSAEFSTFNIAEAVAVTFCMKELRAASAFCDFINQPLKASFECAGKPIIFSVSGSGFESDYVLATLDEPSGDDHPEAMPPRGGGEERAHAQHQHQHRHASQASQSQPPRRASAPPRHNSTNQQYEQYDDDMDMQDAPTASNGHGGSSAAVLNKARRTERSRSPDEFEIADAACPSSSSLCVCSYVLLLCAGHVHVRASAPVVWSSVLRLRSQGWCWEGWCLEGSILMK